MARRHNRKPPTEGGRDARRKADRERIEQAARELLTTEGWQRWIKVRASNGLSRYSVIISGGGRRRRRRARRSCRRHVVLRQERRAVKAAPCAARRRRGVRRPRGH